MFKYFNIPNHTFFDGKVTMEQIVYVFLCILIILLCLHKVKKLLKLAISSVLICITLIACGVVKPAQLQDASDALKEKGVAYYKTFDELSDNISINSSEIRIRINDTWVSIDDITSVVESGKDKVTIVTSEGLHLDTYDSYIMDLLSTLKK